MSELGRWFIRIANALFPLTYVFAVAAYGLTRAAPLSLFLCAMGGIFCLWLLGHLLRREWPATGKWPWLLCLVILFYGWTTAFLGFADDTWSDESLAHVPRWLIDAFGSYEWALSVEAMTRLTVLLGAMLMAIDHWSDPARARTLLVTIVVTGLGMVIFFVQQKLAPESLKLTRESEPGFLAFATYRYHGNAASYLNLCWPLAAGIVLSAAARQTAGWPLWLVPFVATFVAMFLNVSKAGNVLAIIGIVLLLALTSPFLVKSLKRNRRKIRLSRVIAAAIPLLLILASLPFALPWKRWEQMATTGIDASGSRANVYPKFAQMALERPYTGFGPGTFPAFGDSYLEGEPILRYQHFEATHQDYLQTVIEWGCVGTFFWALLLVPPLVFLLRAALRSPRGPKRTFEGYRIGWADHLRAFFKGAPDSGDPCIAAAGATAFLLTALHALVDFPMQIASIQLYFLTIAALGWSLRKPPKPSTDFVEND